MEHVDIIAESIEKVAYKLGPSWTPFHFGHLPSSNDYAYSVWNGEYMIRVTEGDDAYTVTRYSLNRVEVASVRVSSGAVTADTIAGVILLLAN